MTQKQVIQLMSSVMLYGYLFWANTAASFDLMPDMIRMILSTYFTALCWCNNVKISTTFKLTGEKVLYSGVKLEICKIMFKHRLVHIITVDCTDL